MGMERRTFLAASGAGMLLIDSEAKTEPLEAGSKADCSDAACWDAISHQVWTYHGRHLRALKRQWGEYSPASQQLFTRALGERFGINEGTMTQEKWNTVFKQQDPLDVEVRNDLKEWRTRTRINDVLREADLMHQPFEVYEERKN